jgi:hypothetical protein
MTMEEYSGTVWYSSQVCAEGSKSDRTSDRFICIKGVCQSLRSYKNRSNGALKNCLMWGAEPLETEFISTTINGDIYSTGVSWCSNGLVAAASSGWALVQSNSWTCALWKRRGSGHTSIYVTGFRTLTDLRVAAPKITRQLADEVLWMSWKLLHAEFF